MILWLIKLTQVNVLAVIHVWVCAQLVQSQPQQMANAPLMHLSVFHVEHVHQFVQLVQSAQICKTGKYSVKKTADWWSFLLYKLMGQYTIMNT